MIVRRITGWNRPSSEGGFVSHGVQIEMSDELARMHIRDGSATADLETPLSQIVKRESLQAVEGFTAEESKVPGLRGEGLDLHGDDGSADSPQPRNKHHRR